MKRANLKWVWIAVAVALTCILFEAIVNPQGNFPLDDDWSFAVGVKNLVDAGRLTITAWTLTGSVFHVVSAAALCSIFGFSFDVLRCYTLSMAVIELLCLGWIFKAMISDKPWLVLFTLLCLLANPLFFSLSNTFMTDVPTAALLVLGFGCLWRYARRDSIKWLVAGTIASCCAISNRQVLIILPICFLISELIRGRALASATTVPTSKRIARASVPLLAGLAVMFAHVLWLEHGPGTPFCMLVERQYIANLLAQHPKALLTGILAAIVRSICYLATMVLPLIVFTLVPILRNLDDKRRKLFVMLAIELVLLLPIGLLISGAIMPLGDNVIYDFGLGPILMGKDSAPAWTHASILLWIAVTFFGGIGMGVLVVELAAIGRSLFQACRSKRLSIRGYGVMFALLFCIVYSLAICVRGFFDRYLVQMLAPLLIVLTGGAAGVVSVESNGQEPESQKEAMSVVSDKKVRPVDAFLKAAGCVALVFIAAYSVAGTHDYLSWQREAWSLFRTALDDRSPANGQAITPARVNGTYEFNHWFVYEPGNKNVDIRNNDEPTGNVDFKLSLQPVPGYAPFMERSFHSFLWGDRSIFLLRKTAETTTKHSH